MTLKPAMTITKIAERAQCSIAAVSFVLNGKDRQMGISAELSKRISKIARENNYVPNAIARGLRTKKSNVVGVIFLHLMNDWAGRALIGIRSVFCPENYSPIITVNDYCEKVEKREIQALMQRQVDAIICEPMMNKEIYEFIQHRQIPLVFLGNTLEGMPKANYVGWDTRNAARTATEYLIKSGRKRIACLNWNDPRATFTERHEGYRQALAEGGVREIPDFYRTLTPFESPEATLQDLFDPAKDAKSRPDAILATVDSMALQVLDALDHMGLRLPDNVALITLGDGPGCGLPRVGLSTVGGPKEEMGVEAARIALTLIHDPKSGPMQRVIRTNQLILRQTA